MTDCLNEKLKGSVVAPDDLLLRHVMPSTLHPIPHA